MGKQTEYHTQAGAAQSQPEIISRVVAVQSDEGKPIKTLVSQKSRPAQVMADVAVPLLQAAVSGVLAAALVGIGVKSDNWALWGLIVAGLVWLVGMIQVSRLQWGLEQIFRVDLDGDGYRGKPPMPDVILHNTNGRHVDPRTRQVTLKASELHPFELFVKGCEADGTDMRTWEDKGLPRPTYQAWRDQLIGGGWAFWDSYDVKGRPNTRQGWHLLTTASEILKHCDFE